MFDEMSISALMTATLISNENLMLQLDSNKCLYQDDKKGAGDNNEEEKKSDEGSQIQDEAMDEPEPEIKAPYSSTLSLFYSNPATIESVMNKDFTPKMYEHPHLC